MGQSNWVRRTGLRRAALGLSAGALALLTACGGGAGRAPSADAAPTVSSAVVTLTPGDGAAQVPAQGGVGVGVA